jgi:hypothetical protein
LPYDDYLQLACDVLVELHRVGPARSRLAINVPAHVIGKAPKGLGVHVYGLNAVLPFGHIRGVKRNTPQAVLEAKAQHRLLQELEVNVLRLDPDQGTIIVSEQVLHGRQLRLPLS